MQLPIYLDDQVLSWFSDKAAKKGVPVNDLVNDILKKENSRHRYDRVVSADAMDGYVLYSFSSSAIGILSDCERGMAASPAEVLDRNHLRMSRANAVCTGREFAERAPPPDLRIAVQGLVQLGSECLARMHTVEAINNLTNANTNAAQVALN